MQSTSTKLTSLKAKKEAASIEYNNKLALTEARYVLHKIANIFSNAYNDNIDKNVVIHNSFGDFYQIKTDKEEFYSTVDSVLKNASSKGPIILNNLNISAFVSDAQDMINDPKNGLGSKHKVEFKKVIDDEGLAARLISQCEDDASSIGDMVYMCDQSFLKLVSNMYFIQQQQEENLEINIDSVTSPEQVNETITIQETDAPVEGLFGLGGVLGIF